MLQGKIQRLPHLQRKARLLSYTSNFHIQQRQKCNRSTQEKQIWIRSCSKQGHTSSNTVTIMSKQLSTSVSHVSMSSVGFNCCLWGTLQHRLILLYSCGRKLLCRALARLTGKSPVHNTVHAALATSHPGLCMHVIVRLLLIYLNNLRM